MDIPGKRETTVGSKTAIFSAFQIDNGACVKTVYLLVDTAIPQNKQSATLAVCRPKLRLITVTGLNKTCYVALYFDMSKC